jgi:DNA-binding HxlR family transcriptional regulator
MGSSEITEYCSFTKAVEHLGDRWSLLIVRELAVYGPQGFNSLVNELPGHISRSVLRDRLRKLADLGLVSRGRIHDRGEPYRLTAAGEALVPTILSLRGWAATWLPDDPMMVERDPDVLLAWLGSLLDRQHQPERQVVVEITFRHERERRGWLVLNRGLEPYGCLEDPLLDESRYVYVEAGIPAMIALARGRRSWSEAIADGSVVIFGEPSLVADLPQWFMDPTGVALIRPS